MTTGAVGAFTPVGNSQTITVSATSTVYTFESCDAILLYNTATTPAFVQLGVPPTTAPVATVANSLPIPASSFLLVGTGTVLGEAVTQVAVIGTSGTLYLTPGNGTQH